MIGWTIEDASELQKLRLAMEDIRDLFAAHIELGGTPPTKTTPAADGPIPGQIPLDEA